MFDPMIGCLFVHRSFLPSSVCLSLHLLPRYSGISRFSRILSENLLHLFKKLLGCLSDSLLFARATLREGSRDRFLINNLSKQGRFFSEILINF